MIKSQITLKQLEAFAFVVDAGSFRAAAKALGTTQPNISSRISSLEETLGVTLLRRDAGSVRLTEKGETLLLKTREVLWAGESLLEEAGRQDLIEERLRLGVTELVACSWLQDFLRLLKQNYAEVRVELEVDLSTSIDQRLKEGHLDLALQTGPFETEVSGTLPLGVEEYIWIANKEISQNLGSSNKVEQFFEFPIITHAKHTQAGNALHDLVEVRAFDRSQIVHSSALSACVPMVCEGLGVAVLPKALVCNEIKTGKVFAIESDWLPEPLSFFARYDVERAPLFVQNAAKLAVEVTQAR
jgi:DNA-binding transcriptional LysR family regulator